jgi:NAD(P)-dependent dehydrogenase (short-subunit alcohol dehydrogenase family)
VIVNNAGYPGRVLDLTDTSVEDWDQTFAVNVRGVFLCCKAVIPVMKEQRSGHIINVSSSTTHPNFNISHLRNIAYTTSKFCVNKMSTYLSHQVAQDGIRVNTLCPVLAATGFFADTPPAYLKGRTVWKVEHVEGPFLYMLSELEGTGQIVYSGDWHESRGTTKEFTYVHS